MEFINNRSTENVTFFPEAKKTHASSEQMSHRPIEQLTQSHPDAGIQNASPALYISQNKTAEFSESNIGHDTDLSSDSKDIGTVMCLKTQQIRFDKTHHRVDEEFFSKRFEKLSNDILKTGVNIEPITVRKLPAKRLGVEPEYEIVSGHRRLQACIDHQREVIAIVVSRPRSLSFELDRLKSNLHKSAPSPFESGRQLRDILEAGQFESGSDLAKAIGASKSKVSRELTLANLPPDVLVAFGDLRKLRVLDGPDLARALEKDREAVLAEARDIKSLPRRPDEREVVKRLLAAADMSSSVARCNNAQDLIVKNQVVGNWSARKDDDIEVRFTFPLSPEKQTRLIKKIQKVLGPYVQLKVPLNIDDVIESVRTEDGSTTM